jgi:hypothetical protein
MPLRPSAPLAANLAEGLQRLIVVAAELFDYVKNVNGLCEDLLRAHSDWLGRKNIWRKQDPIRVIKLVDQHIYHLGFEIHEPLDLVLYGIHHWIEHSNRAVGANMSVSRFPHYSASQSFQDRAGAYTEIMRTWLNVKSTGINAGAIRYSPPGGHNAGWRTPGNSSQFSWPLSPRRHSFRS